MKFSVTTDKLQSALTAVMSAVPAKSALPILGNVLLETDGKSLKLSTTDLEISITTTIEAKVTKKGSVAIPAKKFQEIIDALPQTDIEIEAINNRIEMRFGTGDYKIAGMPADEFPRLPEFNSAKEIKISADVLRRMIHKTAFSASNDETRPALNGILWQTSGEKMRMVATDGHRLAKIEADNTKLQGLYGDMIVPPRALNLVNRLAVDSITEVGVTFNENNLIFTCGGNTISTRVIEGPYPNYEQVIPKYNNKSLIVAKSLLADTVRRVAILSNALTHQVKFSISKNTLQLSATNVDFGGEAVEKLPCQYDGEDIEIGYNAAYVLDILKQLECDEVRFSLSTAVSAAIITTMEPSSDYLCLVMPLRLAD
jgi:DNA polymerase-3 subunit beta